MSMRRAALNQPTIWAYLNRAALLLFMIMPPLSYFYLRRKRNSSEVDFDERDTTIRIKAKAVSFFTLWALLLMLTFFAMFYLGDNGSVAAFILPIVFCGLAVFCTFTYSVAILVQYGRGSKGERP